MAQPLVRPIAWREPLIAFAPLADRPMAVLLDSALPTPQGRISYIAVDPFRVLHHRPSIGTTVDGRAVTLDPFAALAEALAPFRRDPVDLPVPFGGGAVGLFGYELGGTIERLPPPRGALFATDMAVGLYDTVAAFDHTRQRAWIIARDHADPGGAPAASRAAALEAALGTAPLPAAPGPWPGVWQAETTRANYEAMVNAALAYIRAGDIFQANLTQRFFAATPPGLDWLGLYRRLRAAAPAPFAAFFNTGDLHLLSASPERFLTVDAAGRVETRPIKGTRPRSADPSTDAALAAALRASGKDRAENLMIVDLLRNDIGRVCRPGSVTVPVLAGLESFPTVHHLVSVIIGQLRPEATALDLLRACFPGGSVTGAPKIRAMEIIHALEAGPRGPYCGALAWLGFDGAMDSSIVIRSLVGDAARLCAQAGGGIVAESDPALEYEESLLKVAPLLAAFTGQPHP